MASSLFLRSLLSSSHLHILPGVFAINIIPDVIRISIPAVRHKHWNQKFRRERAKKVIKVTLPDFDEQRRDEKLSIEEMRTKLKEKGIAPPRQWNEKPMFVSCSSDVFDPFVPPEGDGKMSLVSGAAVKKAYDVIGKKGKSYFALRKIRNLDYEFDVPTLAEKAQEIYIEAQKALMKQDEDKLHDLATEKGFPEMMENVKNKTIVWNFLQSLEPPQIVHIRCQELLSKDNLFGQVTVRFHTQQTLAVYDRFGRLMHGSEETVKDVLEYVVFEKHLTHPHGTWKIHAKIIPDWLPPRDTIKKTFLRPDVDKEFPEPPPDPPKDLTPTKDDSPGLTPAAA